MAIAFDLGLAGESHLFLLAEPCKEPDGVQDRQENFPPRLATQILTTGLHMNPATGTKSIAQTVEVAMGTFVHRDPVLVGFLTQVGPFRNDNFLVFQIRKGDCGHGETQFGSEGE